MAKMLNLVIHTADVPYDRTVTPDDLAQWHLGALKNADGTYTFLSKKVTKAQLDKMVLNLPSGKSIPANKTNGRGWSQVGYSDMINQQGKVINLVPYTFDDVIDSSEVTNGATGYNSNSRHVVLVGGWSKDGKIKNGKNPNGTYMKAEELYTKEALDALEAYIRMQLEIVPNLKIMGHNNCASKTCPNFDVSVFLKERGIK